MGVDMRAVWAALVAAVTWLGVWLGRALRGTLFVPDVAVAASARRAKDAKKATRDAKDAKETRGEGERLGRVGRSKPVRATLEEIVEDEPAENKQEKKQEKAQEEKPEEKKQEKKHGEDEARARLARQETQVAAAAEGARLCGVCGRAAPFQCSRCKTVFYCGREHQREGWAAHKRACADMRRAREVADAAAAADKLAARMAAAQVYEAVPPAEPLPRVPRCDAPDDDAVTMDDVMAALADMGHATLCEGVEREDVEEAARATGWAWPEELVDALVASNGMVVRPCEDVLVELSSLETLCAEQNTLAVRHCHDLAWLGNFGDTQEVRVYGLRCRDMTGKSGDMDNPLPNDANVPDARRGELLQHRLLVGKVWHLESSGDTDDEWFDTWNAVDADAQEEGAGNGAASKGESKWVLHKLLWVDGDPDVYGEEGQVVVTTMGCGVTDCEDGLVDLLWTKCCEEAETWLHVH